MLRASWRIVALTLLIGMAIGSVALANPRDHLEKLGCVDVLVEEPSTDAKVEGLTAEVLSDALRAALKSKLPRLRVGSDCDADLYYNVAFMFSKTGSGIVSGYAFSDSLEAHRVVTISETSKFALATVWQVGGLYVGPRDKAKAAVLDQLDSRVTAFAAAYYEAGNP